MDLWKYFAIGHEDHLFCNPLSEAKFDELIELLALSPGARVVDIACGKAEFLVRTARRWGCSGVGVDISPFCVTDARAKAKAAGLEGALEFVEASGSDHRAAANSLDAAFCLGASWIWGGHSETLRALAGWVKPGGLVLVGEPFWRSAPSPAHLEATRQTAESFGSHRSNAQAGGDHGLVLLHSVVSNFDDWDRYEGYQWRAAERYAKSHPTDPDVPELLEWMHKARDHYLEWGREEIGWGVYLFEKDA